MKYIDAEKLKKYIERKRDCVCNGLDWDDMDECQRYAVEYLDDILSFITSLQHEQPIEGKQVIIITETDGDVNICWDCRSLDDVIALLKSAESFITEKQIEKIAGPGSGPDYATTEGRYSHLFKRQQEQPEVDEDFFFDEVLKVYDDNNKYPPRSEEELTILETIARHFYSRGLNARKEE